MVKGYRHKGLEAFATRGDKRGILPQHADRIVEILSALDRAKSIRDVEGLKGFHSLRFRKEKKPGRCAMSVSGAWRITFAVRNANSFEDLDYLNYH